MAAMEVRGEGVVLRPWRIEDVPAVTAACQDAEIARWLAFVPQPYTEEDARFYIQDCIDAATTGRRSRSPTPTTGEVIGSIDMRINRMQTGHVGYWLAAEARGRGLTTAALRRSAAGRSRSSAWAASSSSPTRTTSPRSESPRRPASRARESSARSS